MEDFSESSEVAVEPSSDSKRAKVSKNRIAYSAESLTLGILAMLAFLFYYVSIPAGILAIVLGVKSYKRAKSGAAKAGVILGIIGLYLTLMVYATALGATLINS
jgi:hypothetical protein